MTILVDQDGVLANFEGEFYRRWREVHPEKFHKPLEERSGFPLITEYPQELHLHVKAVYRESGFFKALTPIPGGPQALKEMMDMGHEVFICTSPMYENPTCMTDKVEWIREHIGEDFVRRIVITKDKTIVNADILIDDRPSVEGSLNPKWEHVLFDRPYNRYVKDKRRITWGNWRAVLSEL